MKQIGSRAPKILISFLVVIENIRYLEYKYDFNPASYLTKTYMINRFSIEVTNVTHMLSFTHIMFQVS